MRHAIDPPGNGVLGIVPELDSDRPIELIVDALHRTEHLTRSRAWRLHLHAVSGVDLGSSGYSFLSSLESEGAQRLADLTEEFGLDQSTVSRRVAALERAGFIDREPDEIDGRVSRVSLSPAGRKVLRRHRRAIVKALAALIEDWSEEEQRALAHAVSTFADTLATAVRTARVGPPLDNIGSRARR
jgi:DNA-binding MarR family transcriptional regulator